jgi:hypothetical protein
MLEHKTCFLNDALLLIEVLEGSLTVEQQFSCQM